MKIYLETERLILKTLDKKYAKNVLRYYEENKDFFEPLDPKKSESFFTLEEQTNILNVEENELKNGRQIRFYIFLKDKENTNFTNKLFRSKNEEKIIGSIAFSNIIGGVFSSCFLGYKLHKNYLRQGFMSEALSASISYIFNEVGLHRIEANIMPGNEASLNLIKSLGFIREGYAPKYLKINGKWEDHIHFSLINDEV